MYSRTHVSKAGKLFSSTISVIAILAVVITSFSFSAQPAAAVTNGQSAPQSFPRVAMWWPSSSATMADVAKLDYVVPFETNPLQPNVSRLDSLRSLNPAQAIFADASTCELNYRQADSSGNPIGLASYDAERIGAIPTSWILKAVGSKLGASMTATTGKQTITVLDGTKFRVGNLVIVDDEKCLVQAVSGNSLTVLRGWAGSTAAAHASGARIAAAVSAWPYSVKVDITDQCPQGRATGANATPGTGTENARSWMVRRTASHYRAAGFDGVAIDLGIGYISWFKGDSTTRFLSIAQRSNPDAEVDYTAYDATWAAGLNSFHTALRADLGPDAAIVVNEATPAYAALNGARIEGFPSKTTTTARWIQKVIGPNKAQYPSYLEWCKYARQPNYTTIQTYGESTTDYQTMRFGLATALMGDGFYAYKPSNTNGVLRYDEYDNAGAGKGYLGQPTGAMQTLTNGAYRRDFDNGIAIVNPTDVAVTVQLGATFRKIKGTQDTTVNDGSQVTQVTIPAKDGIVLLREAATVEPTTPPTTTEPTAPATTEPTVPTEPTVTIPPTTTEPTTTAPTTTEPTVTVPTTTTPVTRVTRPKKSKVSVLVTGTSTALRGATVTFVKVGSSQKFRVKTNSRGRAVKALPRGTYKVKVSYRGKTRVNKTLKVAKAKVSKKYRVKSVH